MKVLLASVGNPDYGQDPDRQLYGAEDDRWVEVATTEQAIKHCMEFIGTNELGGGNWSGGEVRGEKDQVLGRISFNGRYWPQTKLTENQAMAYPGGRFK